MHYLIINPFFDNPHCIILDDAHASENYIANQGSVRIEKYDNAQRVFSALIAVLMRVLPPTDNQKLAEDRNSLCDNSWVEKIPTPELDPLIPEIVSIMDTHVRTSELRFSWSLLRDHLDACHIYLSTHDNFNTSPVASYKYSFTFSWCKTTCIYVVCNS